MVGFGELVALVHVALQVLVVDLDKGWLAADGVKFLQEIEHPFFKFAYPLFGENSLKRCIFLWFL